MNANKLLLCGVSILLSLSHPVNADDAAYQVNPQNLLPPPLAWHGQSESLISDIKAQQTPVELSNFTTTPNYQNTVAYLQQLADSSPLIKLSFIGESAQGRGIPLVHVSSDFSSSKRISLLAQAGIHAGEIDGKDAGLMLLRDIANGSKQELTDDVDWLFLPIFNVDGHENSSIYSRVNQRGPTNMGWRTTAQNINLNRDYAKAQSLEMQALLKVINRYNPSLYLDLHVTDGIDYQYDITYGYSGAHAYSPAIANWLDRHFKPQVDHALSEQGHIPGPLVFAMDNKDISKGMAGWTATPRYSDGYGAARHLATVLVENHSLKPYRQRVLGTYVLLESSLKALASQGASLLRATEQDKNSRPAKLPLGWDYNKPITIDFKGIEYQTFSDPISGSSQVKWLGRAKLYREMPFFPKNVAREVTRLPKAYYLMPEQRQAIATLQRHGIEMMRISEPVAIKLEQLSARDEKFAATPYEGLMRVSAQFDSNNSLITLPKNTVRISTDQPLGKLAFALLEPQGSDSLFQWGLFNTMFQRTEYIEGYAVVPLAQQMLDASPELKQRFEHKLANEPDFAGSERARLSWFYRQSPFYDKNYRRYPVMRQW